MQVLITKRSLIQGMAARWSEQYPNPEPDKAIILEMLSALNAETASEEDVIAIIGNKSWTDIYCDNCQKYVQAAIQMGEKPDYDSATVVSCKLCLTAAMDLFKSGADSA